MSGHHCGLSFPGLCLDRPKSATTLSAKLAKKYLGITTTSLAEHVLCGSEHVHKYTFKQDPEEANMHEVIVSTMVSVCYVHYNTCRTPIAHREAQFTMIHIGGYVILLNIHKQSACTC